VKVMAALIGIGAWLAVTPARATGLTDHGEDLEAPKSVFELDGYLRIRGALLNNLDLDRGPTPSGQLLYPVSLSDPSAQTLTMADMRLRTDAAIRAPGGGLAVKGRIDWLDNVALGSAFDGAPAASTTQRADQAVIQVKRIWGEVLTPVGLIAAGRMGSHWGLGLLTNGGDCSDCDSGDASDRIAFVTPLLDHLLAVAYDFSATGPFVPDRAGTRAIAFEPSAAVHTVTFAVANWRGPAARARRSRAGKITVEYGSFVSYRWQENDIPATYLPVAQPVPINAGQTMARGYAASAFDGWLRLEGKSFRVEAEAAYLHASVDQASLIPGVLYREPVTSDQLGAALESEVGDDEGHVRLGFDAGYASGDAAPGFGAFPKPGQGPAQAGDLDGPQANPPFDAEVQNFRFHPDYRVDRILFREIVGTVTDAAYLRPHVRYDLVSHRHGRLSASLAAIVSFAMAPESAPGQKGPLGVEIDPSVRYVSDVGFEAALEQATLVPLSGLDNPALGLAAKPAQLWRLRLVYGF
jgi:uncharacterized protein (TIGR04551 family)